MKPATAGLAGTGMGFGLLLVFLVLSKLIKVPGLLGGSFSAIFMLAGLILLSAAVIVGLGGGVGDALWLARGRGQGRGSGVTVVSPTSATG